MFPGVLFFCWFLESTKIEKADQSKALYSKMWRLMHLLGWVLTYNLLISGHSVVCVKTCGWSLENLFDGLWVNSLLFIIFMWQIYTHKCFEHFCQVQISQNFLSRKSSSSKLLIFWSLPNQQFQSALAHEWFLLVVLQRISNHGKGDCGIFNIWHILFLARWLATFY